MRLVLLSLAGYEVRGLYILVIYKHISYISIYISNWQPRAFFSHRFIVWSSSTAIPRYRRASSLSLSTSSFGTALYKRLASGNHDNIIYSPLSVYTALTMTLLGAGGVTETELMVGLDAYIMYNYV